MSIKRQNKSPTREIEGGGQNITKDTNVYTHLSITKSDKHVNFNKINIKPFKSIKKSIKVGVIID